MEIELQNQLIKDLDLSGKLIEEIKSCSVGNIKLLLAEGANPNFQMGDNSPSVLDFSDPISLLSKTVPCGFYHAKNISSGEFTYILQLLVESGFDIITRYQDRFDIEICFVDAVLIQCATEIHVNRISSQTFSDLYASSLDALLKVVEIQSGKKGKFINSSVLSYFIQNCHRVYGATDDQLMVSPVLENGLYQVLLYLALNPTFNDWTYRSTRGMTPLHFLACLQGLTKSSSYKLFIEIAVNKGADINATDIFGYTPLHTACAADKFIMVPELIEAGADTQFPDLFGWTPFCTASKGTRRLDVIISWYDKNEIPRPSHEIISILKKHSATHANNQTAECVCSAPLWSEKCHSYIKHNLGFFELFLKKEFTEFRQMRGECIKFISQLLTSSNVGPLNHASPSVVKITSQVDTLMHRIAKVVGQLDPLFQCKLSLAGSVAEKTKIGFPDEFDYNGFLTKLSAYDHDCFYDTSSVKGEVYFLVLEKNETLLNDWVQYCQVEDGVRILSPGLIQGRFGQLILKAMLRAHVWEGLSLYWRSHGKFVFGRLEPLQLVWTGQDYPEMLINIDILPLFNLDKWPPNYLSSNIDLIPPEMKEKECSVILKRKSFRLTAINQELYIMKNLSTVPKQAYILCKILMQLLLYSRIIKNIYTIQIDKIVPSSYELKNALFFILSKSKRKNYFDTRNKNSEDTNINSQNEKKITNEIHNLASSIITSVSSNDYIYKHFDDDEKWFGCLKYMYTENILYEIKYDEYELFHERKYLQNLLQI